MGETLPRTSSMTMAVRDAVQLLDGEDIEVGHYAARVPPCYNRTSIR